jgi:acetyl-CoA carboxylase alpha subunit
MPNYILDFEAPLQNIYEKIEALKKTGIQTGVDVSSNIKQLQKKLEAKTKDIYSKL